MLGAAELREISQRFPGRWLRGYVRGKLDSDPVYAAAAARINSKQAPVLDIGCGIGLFAHYLQALDRHTEYLGIDLDAYKIGLARRAAADARQIRFEQLACETLPAWQGHVIILDTLHYLGAASQQRLLREASLRVAPGAALVIRSVLRDASWRFRVTQLEEFLMHGVRWMRYRALHYPDIEELRAPLAEMGLRVQIEPLWGRTPFNSYLIVARRAV